MLRAGGSHLFPGCRGALSEAPGPCGPLMVEFADGSVALGQHRREGEAQVLSLAPYRTARGTDVPARAWAAEETEDGGATLIRITARREAEA